MIVDKHIFERTELIIYVLKSIVFWIYIMVLVVNQCLNLTQRDTKHILLCSNRAVPNIYLVYGVFWLWFLVLVSCYVWKWSALSFSSRAMALRVAYTLQLLPPAAAAAAASFFSMPTSAASAAFLYLPTSSGRSYAMATSSLLIGQPRK